ncbi:hypothetical protein RJ639_046136 [Escallonia herrerae]|uniref:Uncharacterized protein n=1 Tax=Escallonia herrerae TaxID=1293975 RepID=A0AA88W8C6_9ASTE|nr:hypothetical protein RJ639_046136 [Escallonia herrerae]
MPQEVAIQALTRKRHVNPCIGTDAILIRNVGIVPEDVGDLSAENAAYSKHLLSMESSTTLPLSHLSTLMSIPHRRNRAFSLKPWKQRTSQPTRFYCQKMYVPGFGEASPEAKAARNLHNFFTYIAVRIVTAQLEFLMTEQSYNTEAYKELMEFMNTHSLNDGDQFCANLMRESPRHKSLAMRILEVRSAYCKNDFEWDNLNRLASKMADESNTRLMRDYVLETSHVESEE